MKAGKVADIFLWSMSAVYLWAFSSLYYQIPGLYGDNGLLPVRSQLRCDSSKHSAFHCSFLSEKPTLLYLAKEMLGVGPSQAMEVLCLIAIFLASLSMIFRSFRDFSVYAILWGLYFSCFQVGQTFLWFQWDTLLIEIGFLTILVAPIRFLRCGLSPLPHDRVTLFLVRWLAFRLMFASGIVKLTSECPTWWGLTALHWHFESQCIPTSPAWFAHQLPDWFKKLSVAGTYLIEILIPPMFLLPLKSVRVFAFWSQIFLMVAIVITGNYNFFNLLYGFACLPLLVDSEDSNIGSGLLKQRLGRLYTFIRSIMDGVCFGGLAYWTVKLFNVKFVSKSTGSEISSHLSFSKDSFYATLQWAVPLLIIIGTGCFLAEVAAALLRCFADLKSRLCLAQFWALFQCVAVCLVCAVMFAISLVPFSWLDRGASDMIWPEIVDWHRASDRFQLTHSYGLFRHMTGVGGRPEVIIEGAERENGPWKKYEFLYKPGALDRSPPFIVPHQPRIDWQLWFAALGTYERNPWFISLVYRLLHNQIEVLQLIDRNPFPGEPPKFIRATLYKYHYTSAKKLNKHYDSVNWWWREKTREYMPSITANNPSIVKYLTENNFIITPNKSTKREEKAKLSMYLKLVRGFSETLDAPVFVWSLTGTVFLAILGKRFLIG